MRTFMCYMRWKYIRACDAVFVEFCLQYSCFYLSLCLSISLSHTLGARCSALSSRTQYIHLPKGNWTIWDSICLSWLYFIVRCIWSTLDFAVCKPSILTLQLVEMIISPLNNSVFCYVLIKNILKCSKYGNSQLRHFPHFQFFLPLRWFLCASFQSHTQETVRCMDFFNNYSLRSRRLSMILERNKKWYKQNITELWKMKNEKDEQKWRDFFELRNDCFKFCT